MCGVKREQSPSAMVLAVSLQGEENHSGRSKLKWKLPLKQTVCIHINKEAS